MKKMLLPVLTLLLLLAGCAGQGTEESQDSTTASSYDEITPQGLYVPDSAIEEQSGGAVRLYDLPDGSCRWIRAMGDQLLLASDGEPAMLTAVSSQKCIPAAQISMDLDLLSGSCQALNNGFAYYDEAENQAIFLNMQLQEVNRLTLSEDIQGMPIFSPDGGEIFYCVGQEIRGLDTQRKISRRIKTHAYTSCTLLDSCFDGKRIRCQVEDEKVGVRTIYISAETGQTLYTDNTVTALYTYGDSYITLRMDGIVPQRIYGTLEGGAQHINVTEQYITGALALGGAVCYTAEDSGLRLAFYDLATGKKTAAVVLDGVGAPDTILADRWSGCVWILASDSASEGKMLLRWDIKASAIEEETVYTGTLYTVHSPDTAGINDCSNRASGINKTHSVRIRIWNEAVKYPGDHNMVPEYQPTAINKVLDDLEPVLAEFPKNFLLKSIASRIRICIVRSIDNEVKSVQYWDENDAFIVLASGVDVRTEFLKGLGYVVDSHVLGNSAKYDFWETLNPEGFVYGTADKTYLTGDTRAFADEIAMESATDDRSRILWQAMQPDNGEMFQAEIMQKKLLLVCQGIRDAWNLERKTEVYPWEQYLTESIAYQN